MIGRVIEITETDRHLSLELGQLVIRQGSSNLLARIPLDDISAIVLYPYGATLSSALLGECIKRNVQVVVTGGNYAPVGTFISFNGHHQQSARIELQINASQPAKKRIWQELVRSKLLMQGAALEAAGKSGRALELMSQRVKSGDSENIEAQAARRYFPIMFGHTFTRNRELTGVNSMLNYGYAVIRAAVARAVTAAGLHPGIGVHHRNALNPMRLVDDLIEPFRPFVDLKVKQLDLVEIEEVDTAVKRELVDLLKIDIQSSYGTSPLSVFMRYTTTSFARRLRDSEESLELPNPSDFEAIQEAMRLRYH